MTWGGWFGQKSADVGINLKQVAVPIVALVATLATGGAAAGLIGSTILEGIGVSTAAAEASIIGSATVATVTGGSVLGAGTGALNAAINNQNIAKGALTGGVTGGVGQLAGGLAGSLLAAPSGDIVGPNQPNVLGSTAAGAGVIGGAKGLAGGTAGALAGGSNLASALRTGGIAGVSGGITSGLSSALDLGRTSSALLGAGVNYGVGKAFQPSAKSTASTIPTQSGVSGFQSAGTPSALGSALFSAPGMGYSPGGPVLGGAGGEDKAPKNVWSDTDKSLRDVGSTVT